MHARLDTKSAGNHEEHASKFAGKHMKVVTKFVGKTQAFMNMMKIFKIFIFKFPEKSKVHRNQQGAYHWKDLATYNMNPQTNHPENITHAWIEGKKKSSTKLQTVISHSI